MDALLLVKAHGANVGGIAMLKPSPTKRSKNMSRDSVGSHPFLADDQPAASSV